MEEEADAAAIYSGREDELERPEDAEWPEWSGSIYHAWNILRDDRFMGAMGGRGRIYFSAIERYACAYDIVGDDFHYFAVFVVAIDEEYVEFCAEREKDEAEKSKNKDQK